MYYYHTNNGTIIFLAKSILYSQKICVFTISVQAIPILLEIFTKVDKNVT